MGGRNDLLDAHSILNLHGLYGFRALCPWSWIQTRSGLLAEEQESFKVETSYRPWWDYLGPGKIMDTHSLFTQAYNLKKYWLSLGVPNDQAVILSESYFQNAFYNRQDEILNQLEVLW